MRKLSRLQPQHTAVVGFALSDDQQDLVLDVRPTTRTHYCGSCARPCASGYDHRERRWRHTDLGEAREYDVSCT